MKTIINVILVLAVLCLAGCSSEDPQSVAFGVNELSFDEKTNTVQLDIIANCPWVITGTGNFVVSDKKEGNGNETITVTVWENDTYEDRMQTITLQSEDGSSTDRFTASQRADFGLSMERPDMIPAEGGEFHIDIRTNDDISSVEVPDWIAYTSSRALTGYTYTFTAEPNKTGGKRRGPVRLRGKETTSYVNVDQDSYVPTGVTLNRNPSEEVWNTFETEVIPQPDYADPSKLKVSVSDGCEARMENGRLYVSADEYGVYTLEISNGSDVLLKDLMGYLPDYVLDPDYLPPFYVGQRVPLAAPYRTPEFVYALSDETQAVVTEDGFLEFTGNKYVSINASVPGTGISRKETLVANRIVAKAWISSYLNWGGMWQVEVTAVFRGKDFSDYSMAISDNNQPVVLPVGKQEGAAGGDRSRIVYEQTFSMYAKSYDDLKNKIKNCRLEYMIFTNGETVRGELGILPEKPDRIP